MNMIRAALLVCVGLNWACDFGADPSLDEEQATLTPGFDKSKPPRIIPAKDCQCTEGETRDDYNDGQCLWRYRCDTSKLAGVDRCTPMDSEQRDKDGRIHRQKLTGVWVLTQVGLCVGAEP